MSKDLLEKAKGYRDRARALRERTREVSEAPARQAMLQAAATWDELADSAEREAGWRDLAQRASWKDSEG